MKPIHVKYEFNLKKKITEHGRHIKWRWQNTDTDVQTNIQHLPFLFYNMILFIYSL